MEIDAFDMRGACMGTRGVDVVGVWGLGLDGGGAIALKIVVVSKRA